MGSGKGYLLSIDCHNRNLVDSFEPCLNNFVRVEEFDEPWHLEEIHLN